ncbi:MAG TPA: hypothetical protein DIW30_08160 [Bacteroidales bacterium]|nr:hypothetical protein [Bacteroidales bacterium]
MAGCEEKTNTDPNVRLRFSCDTLRFDTVFTEMNSPTLQFRVYNSQKQAVIIDQIRLKDGRFFRLNVDGETSTERLQQIRLGGGDSMFVFVKARIEEQSSATPVFIEDEICFKTNGSLQNIILEAFGQDVERLSRYTIYHDTLLGGGKPYLIYDNLVVDTACTLTLREGTTLYMHDNASIVVYGNLLANGTLEKPVHIQGDRLDDIYTNVPYTVVSGKWNGIYLIQTDKGENSRHQLDNTEIISGKVGLYCSSSDKTKMPELTLSNSRIHNFSQYGIVLQNTNATLQNTEISNCAQYCLHLSGGNYQLVHNTIASYYRNTDINIQPVKREDVAAVYINDLSKDNCPTVCKMYNNIITGIRKNNLVLATSLPQRYRGEFAGNYLRSDSIVLDCFRDNIYAGEEDTVFVRPFYSLDDYYYYDFHLDSVSPARGKGLSEAAATLPYDRDGNPRPKEGSDLGCYQYIEKGQN